MVFVISSSQLNFNPADHDQFTHDRFTKLLKSKGIYPYGSKELIRFEDRIATILNRVYSKARKQLNSTSSDQNNYASKSGNIAEETKSLMSSHYDHKQEFFSNFLDKDYLAYSMAYFDSDFSK